MKIVQRKTPPFSPLKKPEQGDTLHGSARAAGTTLDCMTPSQEESALIRS
jgi:hypothetical protein